MSEAWLVNIETSSVSCVSGFQMMICERRRRRQEAEARAEASGGEGGSEVGKEDLREQRPRRLAEKGGGYGGGGVPGRAGAEAARPRAFGGPQRTLNCVLEPPQR